MATFYQHHRNPILVVLIIISMIGNVVIFYRTWFEGRYRGISSFIEERLPGDADTFFTDGMPKISLTDIPSDVKSEVFKNPFLYGLEPIPSFIFLPPAGIGIEDASAFHFANIEAVNAGDSILLGWGGEGLEQYDSIAIYRSTNFGELGSKVSVVSKGERGWRDTTVDPKTTYFYTIRGIKNDGSEDSFLYQYPGRFINTDVPPVPEKVRASKVSSGEIVISWKNPNIPDFNFSRVYRSIVPGVSGTLIADFVREEEYHDTNVEPGGEYYYTVTTVDTSFNESYSRIPPALFRNVFQNISADEGRVALTLIDVQVKTLGREGALELSWKESANARFGKVRIYKSDSFESLGSVIGEVAKPETRFVDKNIVSEGRYYYTLRAVDTLGKESQKEVKRVGIFMDATPPGNPKDVSIVQSEAGKVTISWKPPSDSDVVSYRVYRSARTGEAGYLIASDVTDLNLDDTFTSRVTFYYSVSAVDSAGNESEKPLPYAIRKGRVPFIPLLTPTTTPAE